MFFIDGKTIAGEYPMNQTDRYRFFMIMNTGLSDFDHTAVIYPLDNTEEVALRIYQNLNILASEGMPQSKSIASHKLANIFFNLHLFESAQLFADSGLVYLSQNETAELRYNLLEIKALSLLHRNMQEAAGDVFIDLIRLAEQLGQTRLTALNLLRTSAVFTNLAQLDRGQIYLQAALEYEKDERVPDAIKQAIKTEETRLLLLSDKPEEALHTIYQSDTTIDLQELALRYALLAWLPIHDIDTVQDYLNHGLQLAQQMEDKALYALLLSRLLNIGIMYADEQAYGLQKQIMQFETKQNESIRNRQDLVLNQLKIVKAESHKSDRSFQNYYIISYVFAFALLVFIMLKLYGYQRRNRSLFREKTSDYHVEKEALSKTADITSAELETRINERKHVLFNELEERKKVDTELTLALKEAEKANYLKNAFLSNMSHEIRTPLNGILGFSSLLEVELALLDNPELYEYANSIQQSGERLLHLLNNIIDISRIEANDLELDIKPQPIGPLLDKCIDLYAFKANEKGVRIINEHKDFDQALYVSTDKNTLDRVLCEILDNAVKYTEKGFIRISLSVEDEHDTQFVRISIKDTGIGIDETYLPHIFEAFRQESLGYSRLYQGAGLGLPLAHRMMELMGGTLHVTSQKSAGTTIALSLPLATQTDEVIRDKIAEEELLALDKKELKNLRLLIVEDDKSNLLLLKKMVDGFGEVHTVMDGEQTISYVEEKAQNGVQFDLFLIDINLPAPWDGIKLMHAIKHRWTQYENSLFVAITAYAMIGDRERMIEAGFDDYVPKPVEKDNLIRILKRNWFSPEKMK